MVKQPTRHVYTLTVTIPVIDDKDAPPSNAEVRAEAQRGLNKALLFFYVDDVKHTETR